MELKVKYCRLKSVQCTYKKLVLKKFDIYDFLWYINVSYKNMIFLYGALCQEYVSKKLQNRDFANLSLRLKSVIKNSTKMFECIVKWRFCKSIVMPKKCLTKSLQVYLKNMIKSHILFICLRMLILWRNGTNRGGWWE